MAIKDFLYPELHLFAAEARDRVFEEARATSFDALELFGMAAGLVVVTALTSYASAELGSTLQFALPILNFLIAIPLLALAIGPFLVRRIRRGLRARIRQDDEI